MKGQTNYNANARSHFFVAPHVGADLAGPTVLDLGGNVRRGIGSDGTDGKDGAPLYPETAWFREFEFTSVRVSLRTSGMPTLASLGIVTPGLGTMVTAVVFPAF